MKASTRDLTSLLGCAGSFVRVIMDGEDAFEDPGTSSFSFVKNNTTKKLTTTTTIMTTAQVSNKKTEEDTTTRTSSEIEILQTSSIRTRTSNKRTANGAEIHAVISKPIPIYMEVQNPCPFAR